MKGPIGNAGDFWEHYWIDIGADACCGGVFGFGADIWFDNLGATLFEVGYLEGDLKINISLQFTFTMSLGIDMNGGFSSWCLGCEVIW